MAEKPVNCKNCTTKNFVYAYLFGLGNVSLSKQVLDKKRPNGGSGSFPSGHSFSAFSGASFIQMAYGYKYGAVALFGAGVVGYSRADSKAHFIDDVIAGASIAYLSNLLFIGPQEVNIGFDFSKDHKMINLNYQYGSEDFLSKLSQFKYHFYSSVDFVQTDGLKLSHSGSDIVDLASFRQKNKGTYSSSIGLLIDFSKDYSGALIFRPFGVLGSNTLESNIKLANKEFSAGQEVSFNWAQYDFSVRALKKFHLFNENLKFDFGLGINLSYSKLNFQSLNGGKNFLRHSLGFLPYIHLGFRHSFFNINEWGFLTNWYNDSKHALKEASIFYHLKLSKHWLLGLRLKSFDATMVEEESILVTPSYNFTSLTVKYSY